MALVSLSTAVQDERTPELISTLVPDIISTHILTRLDGSTLAAASCTSSHLRTLCNDEKLWQQTCTTHWPSSTDPIVRQVISTLPAGHKSFFSDSFPFLGDSTPNRNRTILPAKLISAVDLRYKGILIYSKVQETDTASDWFVCSPFRVELMEPKDSFPTRIQPFDGGDFDAWKRHLEENLTLTWITIDPTKKRAANVSSWRPVTVRRHWVTGDIEARYCTIVRMGEAETEAVEFAVVVTCVEGEQEKVQIRQVSLQVEDVDGKCLNGGQCLEILQSAMEGRRRKELRRQMYEEFEEKKIMWRRRKERSDQAIDMACIALGIALFLGFWFHVLFR